MTPVLITPPATEPLTLAEAKAWLRIDGAEEDALVTALIGAARSVIERESRRLMITQGWRLMVDGWPADGVLRLPLAPVQSVTAVRVFDAAGVPMVAPPASYRLEGQRDPPLLTLLAPVPMPGRTTGGIEIDLTCGYGASAAAVPETLRQALRMTLARWFENRGDGEGDGRLPAEVAALVAATRRPRL